MRACDSGFDVCSSELGRARLAFAFEVDAGDLAAGARAAGKAARQAAGRRLHALLDQRVPGAAALAAQIGRAHVCTPVTNAHLVCRLLLEKKNITSIQITPYVHMP